MFDVDSPRVEALVGNGEGGSVRARGSSADAEAPVTGYMVSRTATEWRVPDSMIDRQIRETAAAFMEVHRYAWRVDLYYGAWRDGGYWYFDLSDNILDRESAIRLGRVQGQLAIWDVVRGEAIAL